MANLKLLFKLDEFDQVKTRAGRPPEGVVADRQLILADTDCSVGSLSQILGDSASKIIDDSAD